MMPHHWRPLAHERNSIFKCKQQTCTLHDPWGPEKDIKYLQIQEKPWQYVYDLSTKPVKDDKDTKENFEFLQMEIWQGIRGIILINILSAIDH